MECFDVCMVRIIALCRTEYFAASISHSALVEAGYGQCQHLQLDAYERDNVCAIPPLILFHNLCDCISTGVRRRGVGFDLGGGLACTGDAKVGDVNFLFLVFSDAVNSVLFAGDSTVQLFGSMSLCFRFLP